MKATILSGLIALALGAFTTSCSNILEENGVLNSAAQAGMGELRINRTTDASLNVSTKSGEGTESVQIGSKTYEINKDNPYWNEIYMINRSWVYRHFADGRIYETTYTVEN